MKMSEQTNELFCALAQFQCELDNTSKNKQGHGYKYSDLAACINQAKELLGKYGLAVVQCMGHLDGAGSLITMLTHKSGQYISSEAVMPKAVLMGGGGKNPVQEVGSAITYMRRYNYAAIIGLTQEDDDGKSCQRPQQQRQQQKPQQQPKPINPDEVLNRATAAMSDADMNKLKEVFSSAQKMLKGHTEHLTKLNDIKEIRKAELEVGDL